MCNFTQIPSKLEHKCEHKSYERGLQSALNISIM